MALVVEELIVEGRDDVIVEARNKVLAVLRGSNR